MRQIIPLKYNNARFGSYKTNTQRKFRHASQVLSNGKGWYFAYFDFSQNNHLQFEDNYIWMETVKNGYSSSTIQQSMDYPN